MSVPQPNSFRTGPDERGHYGIYGGRFVAETLMPLILDLDRAYAQAKADPAFGREMEFHLTHYVGRPSPLYFAERMTEYCRNPKSASGPSSTKTASGLSSSLGAKIFFKREDLNHTGAHKVNNVLGQIMLARRMGKPRIIAETGAGMHGVATATLCAKFGLQCIVYMGAVDVERQQANVLRMKALGAEVRPVTSGSNTLKDAMNEALRDWVTNVADTFYCIGTVAGPHPYPMMVRDFQSVIGNETRTEHAKAFIYCAARAPAADWQRSTGLGLEIYPQWNGSILHLKPGDSMRFIAVDKATNKLIRDVPMELYRAGVGYVGSGVPDQYGGMNFPDKEPGRYMVMATYRRPDPQRREHWLVDTSTVTFEIK